MINMKRTKRCFVQLALGFGIAVATADAHAQMALKGKLLFKDDFKTPTNYTSQPQPVADGWSVKIAHSNWKTTRDGVQSVWRGGHMPVLEFDCEQPFSNVVIEVDFRFHRDAGTNSANSGAACRISPTNFKLNPSAYAASVWANLDSKDRQPGMVLEHDDWRRNGITTVDHKPLTLKPNKWYHVRMELIGNAVLANCNGVAVYGTCEKFGLPKTSVPLGSGYCVHEFRRLRIYEATPNPKWTAPASGKTASDTKVEAASGK
jgi:hypothetical protein